MKPVLTLHDLTMEAKTFCIEETAVNHVKLLGVTAVGTYVEHLFQKRLQDKYDVQIGNSANGIDLPDSNILTDIKVTSLEQPQSSCPFKNARQKIFGLGYNLLVFVYKKIDEPNVCKLNFKYCTFIDKTKTADYTTTKRLREMLKDGANKEDLIAYLTDRNIPGDDTTYEEIAEALLAHTPEQGYLTISNALQWRLQYSRVIKLNDSVNGVVNYEW